MDAGHVSENTYLKKSNKRSDQVATQKTASVFYLALKIGYINKTRTYIQEVELKTLYFDFD